MSNGFYYPGIPDAPNDTNTYGRHAGSWTIAGGGSSQVLLSESTPTGVNLVTFSSIPNNYTALRILGIARSNGASNNSYPITAQFNSDAGANYTTQRNFGHITTVTADQQVGLTNARIAEAPASGAYASVPSMFDILLPFYAETNFYKTFFSRWFNVSDNTAGATYNINLTGFWQSLNAINRIDLTLTTGNFVLGSHIRLYGVV